MVNYRTNSKQNSNSRLLSKKKQSFQFNRQYRLSLANNGRNYQMTGANRYNGGEGNDVIHTGGNASKDNSV